MNTVETSMNMSQMQLQQQAGMKVQKLALDSMEQQAAALQKLLQSAQPVQDPSLGQNIDILA